jgi:hypothetical protein
MKINYECQEHMSCELNPDPGLALGSRHVMMPSRIKKVQICVFQVGTIATWSSISQVST